MKKLLNVSFSKIYVIGVILISILMLGGYFSYAMFTVTKEKSNAISIVTGNLTYKLEVDDVERNTLTVPSNTTIEFTVTLSNPNNRIARFNFYYLGRLPDGVTAGYIVSDGFNIPMSEVGSNLEKSGTTGSSNTYKIKATNTTNDEITITLGVEVGLDYNDLSIPDNGHLFEEYKVNVSDIVLTSLGENGDIYNDGEDTFITGEDPNNYIWYSGKLWRAVSVNNEEKTTKLVTQWNIASIVNSIANNSSYANTFTREWLNDTTVDGFLYNLRDYEDYIVTDYKWNATTMTNTSKPPKTTMVSGAVGLLNLYEYTISYRGTDYSNGYLNNGINFWTITPYDSNNTWFSSSGSRFIYTSTGDSKGVRPSIVLKNNIEIVEGSGTEEDPYRLEGDNDKDLNGVKLNTRYSGEYIKFGKEPNNLYRIVSHENGVGTKITSIEPLKSSIGAFLSSTFGSNITYSSTNTVGTFLNGEYLNNYIGNEYLDMIENETTWYLGIVQGSYKLAKYTDTTMTATTTSTKAKVGLLRMGELMTGQYNRNYEKGTAEITNLNVTYYLITPYTSIYMWIQQPSSGPYYASPSSGSYGIKPALNLKSNVVITGGDGTKNNPFTIELG